MTTSHGPWIIFLDMLGTKESTKVSRDEYPSKIEHFGEQIVDIASSLKCDVTMRLFSDSVYLQLNDFQELRKFCASVILSLFSHDVFFKGAISPGTLDEKNIVPPKKHALSGRKIDIQGSVFGESVVPIYYAQENFKGIGFRFEPNKFQHDINFNEFEKKYLIRSAYPIANNKLNMEWKSYFDIKLNLPKLSSVIPYTSSDMKEYKQGILLIECVIEAALRAERSKKDLSRYYLSFLHSIVQNSDFSQINYASNEWSNFPIIFKLLFLTPNIRNGVLSIKGGSTLFLHMTEKILSTSRLSGTTIRQDSKLESIANQLVSELVTKKIIKKTYPETPSFIFSEETRQFVAKKEISLSFRTNLQK